MGNALALCAKRSLLVKDVNMMMMVVVMIMIILFLFLLLPSIPSYTGRVLTGAGEM